MRNSQGRATLCVRFSAAESGSQSLDLATTLLITPERRLEFHAQPEARKLKPDSRHQAPYPRTLILENDSTARDEIGCPIDIAGRNVVKISIRFTCGRSS